MPKKKVLQLIFWTLCVAVFGYAQGQQSQDKTQTADQGSDPAQTFVSPLGLGTGATLAVTSKGTSVSAAVERQMVFPGLNFWQVALSGTTDKNGQAQVFSSSDKDAPGFKAKVGFGHSSFIKLRPLYTGSGSDFLRQAWCRDLANVVNKSLVPANAAVVAKGADCATAVALVGAALTTAPPADNAVKDLDQTVIRALTGFASIPTMDQQTAICNSLKDHAPFFQFCPAKVYKTVEEQRRNYPELYAARVLGQPSPLQWKLWAGWAPVLNSIDYRSINAGTPDLATKLQWTHLLNTAVGDLALYYGPLAFGVETGYGQTVQVKTQNVCNNTTSGTHTAQLCEMAMVGQPTPKNAWTTTGTLDVHPLPVLGKSGLFHPGAQVIYTYVARVSGGHSAELGVPFYLAPSTSPMKFVFGLQPSWDWDTDPRVGKKFAIALFVGARPEVTK